MSGLREGRGRAVSGYKRIMAWGILGATGLFWWSHKSTHATKSYRTKDTHVRMQMRSQKTGGT